MNTKTTYIFFIFLIVCHVKVFSQVGDQRRNLAIGVNGGISLNKVTFNPTVLTKNLKGSTFGLTARYISEVYFGMRCGAQIEVNYQQRGWDEFYQDFPELQYTRKMNYIDIPFFAHMGFGKDKGFQFFINLGPEFGYFLSDSYTVGDGWEDTTYPTQQHALNVDKKFDYGIGAGGGIELKTKMGNFLLEGRYYYGLSDFYNNEKKDIFARSAHNNITIKAPYLFDIFNK